MELELVEKVLPGTYEISNSFIRFYFRFLFPHQTAWRRDNGRAFYETYIREDYSSFVRSAYRRICQEILQADFHTVELKKAVQAGLDSWNGFVSENMEALAVQAKRNLENDEQNLMELIHSGEEKQCT